MTEGPSSLGAAHAASMAPPLADFLDRDPMEWRAALDRRYGVLDEVLAGRQRAVVYPAAQMGRQAAAGLMAMGVKIGISLSRS